LVNSISLVNYIHYVTNACLASHGLERKLYALPSLPPLRIRLKKESRVNPRLLSPPLLCTTAHRVRPLPQLPFGAPPLQPTGLKSSSAADCRTQVLIGAPLCLQAAARQLSRCFAGSRDCSLACPSSLHCHLPPMGTRFEETPPLPSTFSFRSSCGEERDGGCRI